MNYLPQDATIEQACKWLQEKTGQTWILSRLLECRLTPYFWLDYKPGYPAIYGNRIEGYQTRLIYQGDLCRLEADGADALVNVFTAYDGSLIRTEPGWRVPLSELRFKREKLVRVAEIINNTAQTQNATTPAPVVAVAVSGEADKAVPGMGGLPTNEIATIFDGVNGWATARWSKNLSASKWLHPARIALGCAGGASTVWNPLILAQLMHSKKKEVQAREQVMKALNSRFTRNPVLTPWRDAFNEYFSTHCTVD